MKASSRTCTGSRRRIGEGYNGWLPVYAGSDKVAVCAWCDREVVIVETEDGMVLKVHYHSGAKSQFADQSKKNMARLAAP